MVGIFSQFSSGKGGHRRTQSATDLRESLQPSLEVEGPTLTTAAAAVHGIEVAIEFKPVEHPTEPLNNDQPIRCPQPEPSILNDGRIWKERMSSMSAPVRADLPVVKEEHHTGSEAVETPQSIPPKRRILPSLSAPEHHLLNLLEEYINEDKAVGS